MIDFSFLIFGRNVSLDVLSVKEYSCVNFYGVSFMENMDFYNIPIFIIFQPLIILSDYESQIRYPHTIHRVAVYSSGIAQP